MAGLDFGSIFSGVTDRVGSFMSNATSRKNAAMARDMQAQQNAMNWDMWRHQSSYRAADATEAERDYGINRLALLGQSGNFSPAFSVGATGVGGDGMGEGIRSAGQDFGRAITAATEQQSRADQLNEQLLEAKIANVQADTVRMQAAASEIATKINQPATANVPFPTPDPRGPVIPLVQRAYDARTNEYVWIPSEKAASPLQTLAASPTNAALAGRSLTEGLIGQQSTEQRRTSRTQYDPYTNWYGAP